MPDIFIIDPTPPPGADEVCDFCGSVTVVTIFRTVPGIYPVPALGPGKLYQDDGEWDACGDCAPAVRSHDRIALADRAKHGVHVTTLPPAEREEFGRWVDELQGIFWRTFVGEGPRG